jgi:hypothetical protein
MSPHFSQSGNDTYICQVCATIFDSVECPPVWRPDLTGNRSAGNICPACLKDKTSGNGSKPLKTAMEWLREANGLGKTIHTVNRSHTVLMAGRLLTEASTIGLNPGEWPEFIAVVDDSEQGYLFRKSLPEMHEEQILFYGYQSKDGMLLIVGND